MEDHSLWVLLSKPESAPFRTVERDKDLRAKELVMAESKKSESFDTIVIGGGQAGLATGYYLMQKQNDFVILDAGLRTGDSWRNRWDSLRLFTPARIDGLPGMTFPAPGSTFITKDEMADYVEAYASHFDLPVRHGVTVDRLSRDGNRFLISAGNERYAATNVVVAMSNCQMPWVPPFAAELAHDIVQLHSKEYRNPSQLQDGRCLWLEPATPAPTSRSRSCRATRR